MNESSSTPLVIAFVMVGLGVMGRNLVLNMTDQGCAVAACDKVQLSCTAAIKSGKPKPEYANQKS